MEYIRLIIKVRVLNVYIRIVQASSRSATVHAIRRSFSLSVTRRKFRIFRIFQFFKKKKKERKKLRIPLHRTIRFDRIRVIQLDTRFFQREIPRYI